MRRQLTSISYLLSGFLFVSATLQAGLIYEFDDLNGNPTATFSTSIGSTVDVRVYLKETPGTSFLADEELFGASVRVTFNSPSGIAAVLNDTDIFPNPGFSDLSPPPSVSAIDAGFTGSVGLDPFLTVDANNRIFLGMFRFTGQSVGTVNLSALDRDSGSDDTITGQGTVLDSLINSGSATLSVNSLAAVPEPSSLLLMSLAIPWIAARRYLISKNSWS